MKNTSTITIPTNQNKKIVHRRTQSSTDYDLSSIERKQNVLDEKIKIDQKEQTKTLPPNSLTLQILENSKEKFQNKEEINVIVETLELSIQEQQKMLNGGTLNNGLIFGKQLIKNDNNQVNKDLISQKYQKQLDDEKISTIFERNDLLSNDDNNSALELSPISKLRNSLGDFDKTLRKSAESTNNLTKKKKNKHSNSQEIFSVHTYLSNFSLVGEKQNNVKNNENKKINIGKNILVFNNYKAAETDRENLISEKKKNNLGQLDNIIIHLASKNKISENNLKFISKKIKNDSGNEKISLSKHIKNNFSCVFKSPEHEISKFDIKSSPTRNINSKLFHLEKEILNLKEENINLKKENIEMRQVIKRFEMDEVKIYLIFFFYFY